MKKHLAKLFVALALLSLAPFTSSAKTIYDFLTPVRTEITNQLFIITNTPPIAKSNLVIRAKLLAGLKAIDRPTATNLLVDLQTLNVETVLLSRSSLSNTFLPLLDNAAANYYDVIFNSYTNLTNQLTAALPSGVKTATERNLTLLFNTLQAAATNNNFGTSIILLNRSGAILRTSTALVARSLAVPPGANIISAKIGGTAYVAKGLIGGTHSTGVLGVYEDATHILAITSATRSGTGLATKVKTLTFDIGGVVEGTKTYNVGGGSSDAIVTYLVGGLTGSGASTSTSGTITMTKNSAKKVVSGSYSFNIDGTLGAFLVTGTFMVNY